MFALPDMRKLFDRIYSRIERFWQKNRVSIAIAVLSLLFFLIYFWNDIAVSVYSGQQGILWNRFTGTVVEDTYDEGMHIVMPWNKFTIYELRVQENTDTISALTIDGMALNIYFSILHRPLQAELGLIHQNVGPDYFARLIKPTAISAIRQVIGTLRTEDLIAMPENELLQRVDSNIYSHSFEFQYRSQDRLIQSGQSAAIPQETPEVEGQIVPEDLINLFQIDVKIRSLALPRTVQAAINEKLVHEQAEETYEFRLRREEREKERKIIEAEGIKQFQDISGVSILQWRGIEATETIANSDNTKIIIIGTDQKELPLLLNGEAK